MCSDTLRYEAREVVIGLISILNTVLPSEEKTRKLEFYSSLEKKIDNHQKISREELETGLGHDLNGFMWAKECLYEVAAEA